MSSGEPEMRAQEAPDLSVHDTRPPQLRRPRGQGGHAYEAVQAGEEFQELRARFRRFVVPVTAGFLTWYFLYVLAAAFAPGFMATRVVGNVNVGLVFGLLQFVSTFGITVAYSRWAERRLDPTARLLRERIEQGELR